MIENILLMEELIHKQSTIIKLGFNLISLLNNLLDSLFKFFLSLEFNLLDCNFLLS